MEKLSEISNLRETKPALKRRLYAKYLPLHFGQLPCIVWPNSSHWVKIRLHAENQLPRWSGSGLNVCGGWRGGVGHGLITLSLQLEWNWVELGCDKKRLKKDKEEKILKRF